MAFQAFNFGKQLGIVGSNPIESRENQTSIISDQYQEQHRMAGPDFTDIPDLSDSNLPPIVGDIKPRLVNHFVDCPPGAFLTLVGQNRWIERSGGDFPPREVVENYFGCEIPYGSSGTGGGVEGPLQQGPYIKRKDPEYEVRFKPCSPGTGGNEGICCNEEQKKKIKALINNILNDIYVSITLNALKQCMVDALRSLEFVCVKDLGYSLPEHWDENSWTWEAGIQRTGKVPLTDSMIDAKFLVRAMLAQCLGWGGSASTHNKPTILESYIVSRESPSCKLREEWLSTFSKYGGSSSVYTKFFEWDYRTGKIYLLNPDGSRGKHVNRGMEEIWKCKKDQAGKYKCCP